MHRHDRQSASSDGYPRVEQMITGPDEHEPRKSRVWHQAGRNETPGSRCGRQAERRHKPAEAADRDPAHLDRLRPVNRNDRGDPDAFDHRDGPESGRDRPWPQAAAPRAYRAIQGRALHASCLREYVCVACWTGCGASGRGATARACRRRRLTGRPDLCRRWRCGRSARGERGCQCERHGCEG